MQRNERLQILVEAAVMIALAAVLSLVKVFQMPYGGSVTAGSMIPILYLGLRRGWPTGLAAGVVLGLINYISEPWFLNPIQFLLDYPLAFGFLGLAGLVRNPIVGAAIGITGRFASHYLAGVVYWGSAVENMNAWLYSALYNGAYLLPELALSGVILYFLYPALERATRRQTGAA